MDFNEYQKEASATASYPSILELLVQNIRDYGNNELADEIMEKVSPLEYQSNNVGAWIFQNIPYALLGLAGETGEVTEKVKKIIRNKNGSFSDSDIFELKKELGDVLWYIAEVCTSLNISLDHVAEMNIEKLKDRQRRGVIKSSGDNR